MLNQYEVIELTWETIWGVAQPLLAFVGVPMLRSVGGWASKALEDAKITRFEWKLLGATTVRVGLLSLAVYFGVNEYVGPVEPIAAGFAAFLMDKFFSSRKPDVSQ